MVSRTDECAQTRGIEPDLTVQHVHASGTEPWMSNVINPEKRNYSKSG